MIDIEFKTSQNPVPYEESLAFMEQRVADIIAGKAGPCIWFLEHPPLYTGGTSAKPEGLVDPDKFPVYMTGRGGEYTYHGPGQLVVYVMMDLKQLFAPAAPDLKAYIARLEAWIIAALVEFGVQGFIKPGMIGVWVRDGTRYPVPGTRQEQPPSTEYASPSTHEKIAAIGVRVRKWVAYHGICINVHPNLDDYNGIVPCGISEFGVTSLKKLGKHVGLEEVRKILRETPPFGGA